MMRNLLAGFSLSLVLLPFQTFATPDLSIRNAIRHVRVGDRVSIPDSQGKRTDGEVIGITPDQQVVVRWLETKKDQLTSRIKEVDPSVLELAHYPFMKGEVVSIPRSDGRSTHAKIVYIGVIDGEEGAEVVWYESNKIHTRVIGTKYLSPHRENSYNAGYVKESLNPLDTDASHAFDQEGKQLLRVKNYLRLHPSPTSQSLQKAMDSRDSLDLNFPSYRTRYQNLFRLASKIENRSDRAEVLTDLGNAFLPLEILQKKRIPTVEPGRKSPAIRCERTLHADPSQIQSLGNALEDLFDRGK